MTSVDVDMLATTVCSLSLHFSSLLGGCSEFKEDNCSSTSLLKGTNASSNTDEIYLLEPISHPDGSQSETTGDGEQEYHNMEPTYDLPTSFHRTEHGRSGSVKEPAVKHQLAKNPHTEV